MEYCLSKFSRSEIFNFLLQSSDVSINEIFLLFSFKIFMKQKWDFYETQYFTILVSYNKLFLIYNFWMKWNLWLSC